jgi:hypothetical protein
MNYFSSMTVSAQALRWQVKRPLPPMCERNTGGTIR